MSRRIGVRGIIWHEGKLLAVKHNRSGGGVAHYYAIPGGGLDSTEGIVEGLARELFEETGVQATIGRLLFMQQFKSQRKDCDEELEFFYHIENSEDFLTIDLSTTSHGAQEIAVCEFVDPKAVELLLPAFLQQIDITSYIETVQAVLLVNLLDEETA